MKFPKPTPKSKTAKSRADKKVADKVRQDVMDRDGGCRFPLGSKLLSPAAVQGCDGPLEWAHLPDWRRSRTMGQDPEDRHTTEGSMMLCRRHHQMLDQNELTILADQIEGANSVIRWFLILGDS